MAKTTKKPARSQAEIKSGLKKLRKRGLYKPKNPRAAPTKYGKSQLRKFMDVLTGKASVVTAKQKGRKGFGAAREYKGGTVRVKGNKIIVPRQEGEVARFNRKTGRLEVVRRVGNQRYVRTPFKKKIKSFDDIERQLEPGDRVAIPFFRGARGVEWTNLSWEDFEAFWSEYGPGGSKRQFMGLGDIIQIFRVEVKGRAVASGTAPRSGKLKRRRSKKSGRAKKSGPRKSRGR